MLDINKAELTVIADYVNYASGIVLDASKDYLIKSRLGPIVESNNFVSYSELVKKAKADISGKLNTQIVDAISTNETSFFRDNHPFTLLTHKLVPDHFERLMDAGSTFKPSIDIWCAASSTGQEIYSIAMALKEMFGNFNKYRIKVMGTDISKTALESASRGKYSKLEVSRGLSADRLRRHFTQDGNHWKISDEIRSITNFKHANLMKPVMGRGQFDIIFCRYVAIYFSPENRKVLFGRLADALRPNGTLVVGGTESILGMTDSFKRMDFRGSVYYQK